MSNLEFRDWFLPVLAIGYLVFSIIRFVFKLKLNKRRKQYEHDIKDQLTDLQKDLASRSRDLQDSIQMINQEYSQLLTSMSKDQQKNAELLRKKVVDLQKQKNRFKSADSDAKSDSNQDTKPANES
jgi:uncharacterized membrane-anchored protein YhcB (DUF1043 family)